MTSQNWLITGVSSGFGRELATQLLDQGETVIGTVRRPDSAADLLQKYPGTFRRELLDVTDASAVRNVVDRSFTSLGRIDVIVSNAGYGLFGAAEELSDEQVSHIIATNLTGSIQLIRAALPHLRAQGSGRIIQMSTYGGQVAFPGNSMYHATKWGIEGFTESVAQEAAPFGIGVTIVEPGGARTEFRYGSAQVAEPMPAYDGNPAHGFLSMLDPANGLAPRRPGPDGRRHHRQRRPAARPAAPDPRVTGARHDRQGPPRPDRRIRGTGRPGRLGRLPARRVTTTREESCPDENPHPRP
jgi:NAD(P)-dependent dehydrogenase (short-subunit alcohol dehydrogenase family)